MDEWSDDVIDLFDAMAASLPIVGAALASLAGVEPKHEWIWHINDSHAIAKCRVCETVRMWHGDELDINRLLNHD
jgi:hypothetical protein